MFISRSCGLSMACRAVRIHILFFVALYAELHFDRKKRLRKRKDEVVHVAVTILAGDFSDRDMPPVGEIGMVRHPVYLNPRNLLVPFDIADQFLFFLAFRHRFFIAVLAEFNIGNGSFLMGLRLGMTVETTESCYFDM